MTDEEYSAYVSNAMDKSKITGLPIVRQDSFIAPAYKKPEESSALPAIGGIVGGILGGFLLKSPAAAAAGSGMGRTIGAFGASLVPSLVGSSAGTAVGTAGERLIMGDLLSADSGKAMTSNLLENAAWDLGGNLVFSLGGKAVRLGAEQVKKFRNPNSSVGSAQEARNAAQQWLSERGATLSLGQATDSSALKAVESVAAGGTGGGQLLRQEEAVYGAVQQGLKDVRSVLDTSDAFKQALLTENPLNQAAGSNMVEALTAARTEFKAYHRPFYEKLTQDTGVYADFRNIKKLAQQEKASIARTKGAGASSERLSVLDSVLRQDDFVDFGAAHDIRSELFGAANDLAQPGKATTGMQAAYTRYAAGIESAMDKAIELGATTRGQAKNLDNRSLSYVGQQGGADASTITTGSGFNPGTIETKISKDLVNEYKLVKNSYKAGMEGLYGETIGKAASLAPSKVGAYLADLTESEKFSDLYKAIVQIDKYGKAGSEASSKLLGDVKYSFLEKALSTPEKAVAFNSQIKADPDLGRAFYKMFQNEGPAIKQLLNAADIGLTNKTGVATFLRNRYSGAALQGTAAIVGYVGMPDEVKDKIKENLPETLVTAGALLLTPKLIARIATNPDTVNAFLKLAKHKEGTKMSGALATKIAAQLNSVGIIDNEYITAVQSVFSAPKEPITIDQPYTADDYDQLYNNAQE